MAQQNGNRGEPTILKQGFLRKLKTMKKKYFVLRGDTSTGQARLDYYASERKFKDGKSQPRKSIQLHSCLGIGATASTRHNYAVAVHTRDDCLTIGFETEGDRNEWLAAMHSLVAGKHGNTSSSMFEHVWIVNLRPKGLGRGMAGMYRLCLTDRTLSLVKKASSEANFTFPLEVMRRCGHSDNFFFVEVGRQASTGEGELWMEAEDALIAQSAHYAVLGAMHATKDGVTSSQHASGTVLVPASGPPAAAIKAATGSADTPLRSGTGTGSQDAQAQQRRSDVDQPLPPTRYSVSERPGVAASSALLVPRRLSSMNKHTAAPAAASIAVPSSVANGNLSIGTDGQERTGVGDDAERDLRTMSAPQQQSSLSQCVVSSALAAGFRKNSVSKRGDHSEMGDMHARSDALVPAIEITAVGKDALSTGGQAIEDLLPPPHLPSCNQRAIDAEDYAVSKKYTPRRRPIADSRITTDADEPYFEMTVQGSSGNATRANTLHYMDMAPSTAASNALTMSVCVLSDPNYLAMQPRVQQHSPRAVGSIREDEPGNSLTSSSLPPLAAQNRVLPVTGQQWSPGQDGGRHTLRGSQLVLPDLFSMAPNVSFHTSAVDRCESSAGTCGSPLTGSTTSCGSGAARSTASLCVPQAPWLEDAGSPLAEAMRPRTGSDAPAHKAKLAKYNQPSEQRPRSSSHGCVVSTLGASNRSKLDLIIHGAAEDFSQVVGQVDNAASKPSNFGSFEYVAMDFSEPSQMRPDPKDTQSAAAEVPVSEPGARATEAISIPRAKAYTAVIADQGDYVGIDFGADQVGERWHYGHSAPSCVDMQEDEHGLNEVPEPFPELSCSPPLAHVLPGSSPTQYGISSCVRSIARDSTPLALDGVRIGNGLYPKFVSGFSSVAADDQARLRGDAYAVMSEAAGLTAVGKPYNDSWQGASAGERPVPHGFGGDLYAELDGSGYQLRLRECPPREPSSPAVDLTRASTCTPAPERPLGDSYAIMDFRDQQLPSATGKRGKDEDECDASADCKSSQLAHASRHMPASANSDAAAGQLSNGSRSYSMSETYRVAQKVAIPLRATCYIKDDDAEDGRVNKTSAAESGGQHSLKAKPLETCKGLARPRPYSAAFGCAPPLPERTPLQVAAAASKQRHISGSEILGAAVNYASLDLDADCNPPAVSSGQARPLIRPSSGNSLSLGVTADLPRMSAATSESGVQYSRIDFAKLDALRASKS